MGVTLILGSRGRPDALLQTLRDTLLVAARSDTRVLVCLDDDDRASLDAIPLFPKDDRIVVSVRPREDNRGEKCDRALTEAPNDVYAVGHDAASIITKGWDQVIVDGAAKFGDGIGVVCSGMANSSFPAMQAMTKRWVEIVGYIYNHEYPFWYIDHEVDDLCRMTGRFVFIEELEVDIFPRRPGKTLRMRDLHFWCDYYDLSRFKRRAVANRIIDALDCPDWQKDVMRTWYVPVEARSVNVNNSVRMNAFAIEQERGERGEPDPGYLRAFEKARANLKAMLSDLQTRKAA